MRVSVLSERLFCCHVPPRNSARRSGWLPRARRIRIGALSLMVALLELPCLAGCTENPYANAHVNNVLAGVWAFSPDDIWAVGGASLDAETMTGLIEHWNGSRWAVVPSPVLQQVGYAGSLGVISPLVAVAGSGSDDIWAVGEGGRATPGPTIEHWDGRSWQLSNGLCSTPCAASRLNAVQALSAKDAWAVGAAATEAGAPQRPVVEHWDGTQWAEVPGSIDISTNGVLSSVRAFSDTDVWVFGVEAHISPLIAHWNGRSWRIIANASGTEGVMKLHDVAFDSRLSATSAPAGGPPAQRTIWVGGTTELCGGCRAPFALEGSDGRWVTSLAGLIPPDTSVSPPPLVTVQSVAAVSSTDVWAVGGYMAVMGDLVGPQGNVSPPFIMHWDGMQWRNVPSVERQTSDILVSVTALSATDVWAVGERLAESDPQSRGLGVGSHTLIEHWDGAHWSVTPSVDIGQPTLSPHA